MTVGPPEDLGFRSLAAPGRDEDDIFAALAGGAAERLWGEGRPSAFSPAPGGAVPSAEEERRVRHREVLARWEVAESGHSEAATDRREPRAAATARE